MYPRFLLKSLICARSSKTALVLAVALVLAALGCDPGFLVHVLNGSDQSVIAAGSARGPVLLAPGAQTDFAWLGHGPREVTVRAFEVLPPEAASPEPPSGFNQTPTLLSRQGRMVFCRHLIVGERDPSIPVITIEFGHAECE
jgi:hypothetical protein